VMCTYQRVGQPPDLRNARPASAFWRGRPPDAPLDLLRTTSRQASRGLSSSNRRCLPRCASSNVLVTKSGTLLTDSGTLLTA